MCEAAERNPFAVLCFIGDLIITMEGREKLRKELTVKNGGIEKKINLREEK